MAIFKEKLDEEYLTTSEVKKLLAEAEAERAVDEEHEMRCELVRVIEHVNRLAHLDPEESREFVEESVEFEKVDGPIAIKTVDLLPQSRDEFRAMLAQQRYVFSDDELNEILNAVAKYV